MRIAEAIQFLVVFGTLALAARLGLLRPDSRLWHTCLYFAAAGVVVLVCVDLLEFGFADILRVVSPVAVGVSAMAGALTGLIVFFVARLFARREPG